MIMDKSTYLHVEERFQQAIKPLITRMSDDGAQNVRHYLEVGEIEMAYESFILSIIEEQIAIPVEAKNELLELGLTMGLDKESVFKVDFWEVASRLLTT